MATYQEEGGAIMSNTHTSFSPQQQLGLFRAQLEKLEHLGHEHGNEEEWGKFDEETEELLRRTYGNTHEFLESYALALTGEAEALVNMPESAQESIDQDLPQKAFQQRRQLLHAVLANLEGMEQ